MGNDASKNFGLLIEDGSYFIVERNLLRESKQKWLDRLRNTCKDIRHPQNGKTVFTGSVWKSVTFITESGKSKTVDMRIVYEITEHTIDKKGQILLFLDIELNIFLINHDWSDDDIIEPYHAQGV